ncbi:MAG: glycine--tRNA ligase [Patescibacteria group bacterium]|nr:glycine--tRNA ligase [Patescibacteria group bacterium]
MQNKPSLSEITALCKRRGFVYQTSEIYGGLANSYDYGPMGVQLLRNIKDLWWKTFITDREDMCGIDSQILLNPQTWEASGHITSFTDPLVEDKVNHQRYRADHLIEDWIKKQNNDQFADLDVNDLSIEQMTAFLTEHSIKSPDGNELSKPKNFNILFETAIGVIAGKKSKVYLRGETAQGIFTNFKQVLNSTRAKLPFGIGQIGTSFRNEITKGQFVFRTLEFEQAEIEYFFNPEENNWKELFKNWQNKIFTFVTEELGVNAKNLRWREHTDSERSHYSRQTYDLDYKYPFGWKELWGLAYRTDFDLRQHMEHSHQSLEYIDPYTQKKIVPHVVEPAVGIARIFLMILVDAYKQDDNDRLYLDLAPQLAPYQIAVFPLLKNKKQLVGKAREIFDQLKTKFSTTYDERGNIGKRYCYQDEIGTPFCITVDFDSLEDNAVTVRERNSTKQKRVKISKLEEHLKKMI